MCELKPPKAVMEKKWRMVLEGRHVSRLEARLLSTWCQIAHWCGFHHEEKKVLHRTSASSPEAWLPPLSLSRQHQRSTESGAKRQRVHLSLVFESPSL